VDFALEAEDEAFRDELNEWLDANLPEFLDQGEIGEVHEDSFIRTMKRRQAWQVRLNRDKWAAINWPIEWGGREATTMQNVIYSEVMARRKAPGIYNPNGIWQIGPMIIRWGTDEQKHMWLPHILDASVHWCQGFSEPEAGSDLASLRTRATEEDDHFVLNGSKTWVSWGQYARWCGVLARTETDGPKHKGISMLIVDLQSDGVDMRPMTQITGHAEFCELFLDDVIVPKENLLGNRGDGWKIAMHTLGHERGTAALPRQVKLRTWLDRAVADAAAQGRLDDPLVQVQLAQALIGVEVLRHHAYRTVGEFLNGGAVGPDSSSVKLLMAEAEQRLAASAFEILGPEDEFWTETYLYSRAASVYGGTQQIQRNIIADRILALPQE
jgi:alkylation response protein AidB-like acyl-CoA dehydrogenase